MALAGLGLGVALALAANMSALDMRLEQLYFDSVTQRFPWREVRWFEFFGHVFLRDLLVLVAVASLLMLVASLVFPSRLPRWVDARWAQPRVWAYLLLAMLAGPALVGLLKHYTTHACPYDLAVFGGKQPYGTLLGSPLFTLHHPGKCFPGGHASGGFGLLAFVPLLRGRRRIAALALALLTGMLMSWVQMMKGAHFLSHNLWSASLCWACVLAAYAALHPDRSWHRQPIAAPARLPDAAAEADA